MKLGKYEIAAATVRTIAFIVAAALMVLAIVMFTRSCDNKGNKAAQERVEDAQANAASNSAADAIGTVQRSGEATAASEGLTRSNEKDIRNAEGANAPVNPAARDAGLSSLCKRNAYRNDKRCGVFKPHP